jgi:SAM-dependent methyltransferase
MTGFPLDQVDFDDVYSGREMLPGSEVSFDVVPWDIGAPQPAVVRLVDAGEFHGAVLDAGCGLGNNAIFLAERGFSVTGVDGAKAALTKARERAAAHGVDVEFTQADVTTFDGVEPRFDTVLDSALYHCLTDEQRTAYTAALHRVTRPGARLHLLCFADTGNEGLGLPMGVSQDDLRTHLAGQWDIDDIGSVDYTIAMTLETFDKVGAERLASLGVTVDRSALRFDDDGRILGRMWHVRAGRV